MSAQHPRFSIQASGCSESVYKVVGPHSHLYACLLGGRDILDEHPRQNALGAVRRLKPFWSSGPEFFDWTDLRTLNGNVVPPEPEDELLIGAAARIGGGDEDFNPF